MKWSPNQRLQLTGCARVYNLVAGLEPALRGRPATEPFTLSGDIWPCSSAHNAADGPSLGLLTKKQVH